VPPEGVRATEEPNPEPLLVETSKPVGAVTVKSAVNSDPETENLPASEGTLAAVKRFETVPEEDKEGSPPEKSVSDMSSTFALVVPVLVIRTRTEPAWLTVKEAEVNEVLATVTVPKLVQFTPLSELYSTVKIEFASVPYFA
jgi:hypothetical protein